MKNVVVLIGAGQIGQALARRAGMGKHVVLADVRQDTPMQRPRFSALPHTPDTR